ncbi:hypothetical protein BG011_002722, partial [Mortierella polycephala]
MKVTSVLLALSVVVAMARANTLDTITKPAGSGIETAKGAVDELGNVVPVNVVGDKTNNMPITVTKRQ